MSTDLDPWWWRALCREVDPELFFPPQDDLTAVFAAQRVCALCDVRSECLTDAMAAEGRSERRFGIRGGLSARARIRLARRTRQQQQQRGVA